MSVDIGGVFKIEGRVGTTSGLNISEIAGGKSILNVSTSPLNSVTCFPNQIGFLAGKSTDPGWVAIPVAWTTMIYDAVIYNVGNGYNPANGRFTAPVAGNYRFHSSHYLNKVAAGAIVYCSFSINGTGNIINSVRLRGRGDANGITMDGDIADIIPLNAGDFVTNDLNSAVAGMNDYPAYGCFSGVLIG